MLKKLFFYISLFSFFAVSLNVFANSSKYRDELPELQRFTDLTIGIRRINKGLKYESKGKIKKANKMYSDSINFLLKANKNQDIDPDIFFYLGFAYNKLKKFDNAETYYILGLTLEPKNQYINKYLGELYLSLNKPILAKERLKAMSGCGCDEYNDLKNSINKY